MASRHDSRHNFYFPSLTVNDRVASAASSSISMRSSPPHSGEEAPVSSHLEDSAYDFADSSDEEHTESAVSVDTQSLDAISLADSDESN